VLPTAAILKERGLSLSYLWNIAAIARLSRDKMVEKTTPILVVQSAMDGYHGNLHFQIGVFTVFSEQR
jgi:hypothetical protein